MTWNPILNQCYICNREFDGVMVVDHGEHVIQNAIGGGLIAWGILCVTCGANLGKSVDAPFDVALRPLCAVLDIRRSRGGLIRVPARVSITKKFAGKSSQIRCSITRGGHPVPAAPTMILDHEAKVGHLFGANAKQIAAYAESPAVKELDADGYRVRTDSDFVDFVEGVDLEIRPDGLEVARGVLKIAISFALFAGVPPTVIRRFVVDDRDITHDERLIEETVIPYYPTGWGEALYEADRYAADDFPPNHQLLLFSLDDRLFCHVDVFGVIQRYVLLSETWSGPPILKRYLQKCPKWIFVPEDWKARRPKDLDISARQFGISTNGRSMEDVQKDVLLKAGSRPYELPAADHLEKPGAMMVPLVTLPEAQHGAFPTIAALRKRAEIAENEFGSDFLSALTTDRLRLLTHLRHRDPERFRITNENGICPDLSQATSAESLAAYQAFRLDAFVREYAGTWAIRFAAGPAS